MADVDIKSHKDEVLSELRKRIETSLEACGEAAETYAIGYLNRKTKSPTGNLSQNITHAVKMDEQAMYIGTDVEYAIYVEFGTGAANVAGGTTKESWVYCDEEGNWHRGYPQPSKAFLKPAIADHVNVYKNIIQNQLKG